MQRRLQQLLAITTVGLAAIGVVLLTYWWQRLEPPQPGPSPRAKPCQGRYDLIVRRGRVLDGMGRAPVRADVGVNAGRVTCVGDLSRAKAEQEIEAAGLIVAPGFIDVHTHVERNLPDGAQPFTASNFLQQGVTTIITGNCGRSELPLGGMFALLEKNGTQINVAGLVGHNSVRRRVMGEARRAPTPGELAEMQRLVARAMDDGALGLSTGLVYEPGMYSQRDELVALARVAAERGGLYVTHLRDEGAAGVAAIREAVEIGEAAPAPVHISHFKAQGLQQWGKAGERLKLIDEALRRNLRVTIDQYPYEASSTTLELLLPDRARALKPAQLKASLKSSQGRASLRREMLESLYAEGWKDFSHARIAYYQFDTSLNGLNVALLPPRLMAGRAPLAGGRQAARADDPVLVSEAADGPAAPPPPAAAKESPAGAQESAPATTKESPAATTKESPAAPTPPAAAAPAHADEPSKAAVKRPAGAVTRKASAPKTRASSVAASPAAPQSEVERQADAILDLLVNGGAQMIYFDMSMPDVLAILKHQDTMIGSDSGVRLENAPAVPHPRGYGTFPRILSHYVRDLKLLSLAEAVRRMTSLPAQTFGLSDRGRIIEGYWADLVIFNPATISDQATYENPLLPPIGISYVIVNGVVAVNEGHVAKLSAGTTVRRQ
jgi:N-acyl-D-aspartate/D-glutamate deacylase